MQIVIDIDDGYGVKAIHGRYDQDSLCAVAIRNALKRGVVLPKGHRGIVDLKDVKWAFDDAILQEEKDTGELRATSDEIARILGTVPVLVEADKDGDTE